MSYKWRDKPPEPVVIEGWVALENDEDSWWGVMFFDDAPIWWYRDVHGWEFDDGVRWYNADHKHKGTGFSPCKTLHNAIIATDIYPGALDRQRVRITIEALGEPETGKEKKEVK